MPSRCLRIVLEALTKAGSRDREAREIHRPISWAISEAESFPAGCPTATLGVRRGLVADVV
jgi:hypothetical protein